MFNREERQQKRERRAEVKAQLKEQIKPRRTHARLMEDKEKRTSREAKVEERESAVGEHLRQVHAGAATGDLAQLGAELLYLASLSNVQLLIHDQVSQPDKCYTRWTVHGRHDKDFLGIAPTNRDVRFSGVSATFLGEFEEITQEAHYWDVVALLQQIQAP